MKAWNKAKAYAYVKAAQLSAPGHHNTLECRGCGNPIKSCKTGLCKDCQSVDRQYRRENRMSIEHQAYLIREQRAGRI